MDKAGTSLWVRKVWDRRPGGLSHRKSLLVWDSFNPHLIESIKLMVRGDCKNDIAVIARALFQRCSTDVCINNRCLLGQTTPKVDCIISGGKTFYS